jgi:hypothetical protein
MKYKIGDIVMVRCVIEAAWQDGVVEGDDGEHYIVKLHVPQLMSTLHARNRKRDFKADKVLIKKHLETLGIGHLHLRLKTLK